MSNTFQQASGRLGFVAAALLAIAGCQTEQPRNQTEELGFDQAATVATDALVKQTQSLPSFLAAVQATVEAKISKRTLVIDPMLDGASGQQTAATKLLEQRVTERVRTKYEQFDVLPFESSNLGKAQYLLTGTMTRLPEDKANSLFRIDLALTDLKTGNVVAQSSARATRASTRAPRHTIATARSW